MTRIYAVDEIRVIVRKARRDAGYAQARLSSLTGATRKWLSDFECGRSDPPLSLVVNLIVTLGIAVTLSPRPPAGFVDDGGETEIDDGL